MKDKKFVVLSSLFFLLFIIFMAVLNFERPASQILRAKTAAPSPLKSFIIAFPQIGTVGSKIKVSVFMRDVSGNVLPNRSVKLSSDLLSVITSPSETQTTNDIGQAEFYIASNIPGKAKIQAVDVGSNTAIATAPTVEFTQ